jgi:hypothetical protein
VRNVDIEAHLKNLAGQYANIKEITLADAIVGDYGFLNGIRPARGGFVPTHSFMISRNGEYLGGLVRPRVGAFNRPLHDVDGSGLGGCVFIGVSHGGRLGARDWPLGHRRSRAHGPYEHRFAQGAGADQSKPRGRRSYGASGSPIRCHGFRHDIREAAEIFGRYLRGRKRTEDATQSLLDFLE